MRFSLAIGFITSLSLASVGALVTPFPGAALESRVVEARNEDQHHHEHHVKDFEKSDDYKAQSPRGMRCGPALFTPSNLIEATTQACKLLKEKKRTWGFIRYPLSYQPGFEEIQSPLTVDGQEKPQGPFYLYPIKRNGKIFKFGPTGPYRVIMNRECQVAGAVIKLKSKTKCEGPKCWNPFRFRPAIYKSCQLDYFKSA